MHRAERDSSPPWIFVLERTVHVQRIRASVTYPGGGSPGVITLYTKSPVPEDGTSAQLCCDRLRDALTAGHDLFVNSTVFTSDTFVDTLNPVTGAITGSDGVTGWTVAGNQSNGYLPQASMVVATWHTAGIVSSRRVRGRTFLGPLDNSCLQNDGTLASSTLTHAAALVAAWLDAGTTDVFTCVWHRPKLGAGGSDHQITAGTVRDKFGVLRSRRD